MKKAKFVLLPLATLVATAVQAETLGVIDVVTENTGAKSKTNVVTLKQMERSTETDLRGLLFNEPAINFGGGNGGTSQWVTIRGMGQDQIDFKVDNTYSDTQSFHHEGRFLLDPALIKRIDVQKGAGSASAGIGATSGSIIATTVDAQDLLREGQDFGFKLTGGVRSNKGYTQGASVYGKVGAFDALVSGNWNHKENYKGGKDYKNLNGSDIVQNSALGERGLLAKLGWDITENQRVVLSHRQERYYGVRALREEFDFSNSYVSAANLSSAQINKGYQLSNVYAGKDRSGKNAYYVLDGNGNYVVNEENNNPRYRTTTQDTTNLEWTGKNMGFITEAKANVYHTKRVREEGSSKTQILTTGANLNLDSAIGENHLVKYGVNYRKQVGKPNQLAAGAHNQRKDDLGVYVEGIWGMGPVILTTGARYDYFNFKASNGSKASKGHFNPSAGLIWQVSDDLSLNTSLNYATRSPRLYEVVIAGSGKIKVDSNIRAEQARNAEIGFNYDLNDRISLSGSYFWQKVKDAISLKNNVIYNGALLRNQGYELSAAYKHAGLTLRAGVAESKPEVYGNVADNTVFAVATGRTWTTEVSYKFANPNLIIGWKGRFVEGETGTPSRGSGGSASVKQPGYGVNDLYASWEANENLTINVAVDNVFNKNYKSHSQRAGVNSLTGAGRDFRMNVNYTF
ncbi:TonB-dependent receptor domain-containing protein [Avibacterium sp. 21-599]|uniref:TonB-dependent receptor domain-containing protein n=1 Tax=Avibacterium sp. 21-599 TaxID=2911528 RepID=UPI00224812D3|nr:TonB-dependent receptor [Avibacterium sp. 21-599]MCW9717063.1 TonB-dependent receptor [Avibacterium sp. 21-599]